MSVATIVLCAPGHTSHTLYIGITMQPALFANRKPHLSRELTHGVWAYDWNLIKILFYHISGALISLRSHFCVYHKSSYQRVQLSCHVQNCYLVDHYDFMPNKVFFLKQLIFSQYFVLWTHKVFVKCILGYIHFLRNKVFPIMLHAVLFLLFGRGVVRGYISSSWIYVIRLFIFFRVASLTLRQSYNCLSASDVTPEVYGKIYLYQTTTKLINAWTVQSCI